MNRKQYHNKYNQERPVVSFRVTQETKNELERVCKHLETDPANLLKGVLKEYVLNFSGLQKSIREQKAEAVSLEQLRERVSEYLAAGGDFYAARAMFEQFRRQLNQQEQKENGGMFMGKMRKQQVEEKRGEVLDICRKALTSPDAGVEIARQAAELFIALGGNPAELGQIAKGDNPQPGQNIAKAKAQNPRKSAEELKEEALSQPEIQQHSHLFKARGWL